MTATKPASSRAEKAAALKATLDEHLHDLAEQMSQGKSEALTRYLEFAGQFHSYSFRNVMLIFSQRPEATRVAGLRQWNRHGRHVRAGEKGIMILAPMTVRKRAREENNGGAESGGEEAEKITLFKVVHVFDVSQTEGEALPEILEAAGDVAVCLPALRAAIVRAGIKLEEVDFVPGSTSADGASYGGRIVVKKGLSDADTFRTLAHELAHERLHWTEAREAGKEAKTIRETEADAAAFVICRHFGVSCDSADYLLLHDSNPKLLLDRLETIRAAAARIIGEIEGKPEEREEGSSE